MTKKSKSPISADLYADELPNEIAPGCGEPNTVAPSVAGVSIFHQTPAEAPAEVSTEKGE